MGSTGKPVILVVEDDVDLRKILRLQLTLQGYDVREAENGAVGFASLREVNPDCVILDLMMPVLDGFGFLKRARSIDEFADIPVLILTASEDERNRIRGYQYNADAYMGKPYDLEELTAKVNELLARAELPTPVAR